MDSKKKFRSEMFGFKKSDVNNYILSINEELGTRIQELEEDRVALAAQTSDLIDEVARLSNENIDLQANSGLSSDQESELNSQIDTLRAQLNSSAVKLNDATTELNSAIAERDAMQARLDAAIAERDNIAATSTAASQEYTTLKERVVVLEAERVYIADAILTARHEAEKVVAEAHSEANLVYAEMERDVQMLKERMQLENDRIDALRNSAQQAIAQYMDNLDRIQI